MDRRDFLKTGVAALALAGTNGASALAAEKKETETEKKPFGPVSCENVQAGPRDLHVRFLGTGAAGWKPGSTIDRRNSSVLLDGKVLIDFTQSVTDMLPEGCQPQHVFYTHSHGDHYQPLPALQLGVKHVYVSQTWVDRAKREFSVVAAEHKLAVPRFHTLQVGVPITVEGLTFTPLPANHTTNFYEEQAQIYLVEKGTTESHLGVRLIYATDTGGIMGKASRLAGIDAHKSDIPPRPITAFVMEGTLGKMDYRMFNHSTPELVAQTARVLIGTKRYTPPTGQPVYITHMGHSVYDREYGHKWSQDELNARLPWPVRSSYDGLEVVFRAID